MMACCCCGVARLCTQPEPQQSPLARRRNQVRSSPRDHSTPPGRESRAVARPDRANERWLVTGGRAEEIELKCYPMSFDCLVVEADRRCRLRSTGASTRPLQALEDGRKYLDGARRPDSVGLLTLRVDPQSGQLERKLSIHEINEDDEELRDSFDATEDQNEPSGDIQLRKELRVAERLSMRSFVIVERTATGNRENQDIEHELIASVSINVAQADSAREEGGSSKTSTLDSEQQVAAAKRPKRPVRYLKLARRFNLKKMFRGERCPRALLVECCPSELRHQAEQQVVAPLGRPDSIYLWPERLADRYAPHLAASAGAVSPACGRNSDPPLDVMISYNHAEGKDYAVALHAELERLGVRAYLDLYHIRKGQDWQDSLNFAILDCRLFVPLITPSYGETLWTSREVKLADVLAKRIVPINFGQRWPPPSLAIQFATLQYIDWLHQLGAGEAAQLPPVEWPGECVYAIAKQLRHILLQARAFTWTAPPTVGLLAPNSSAHLESSGYESPLSSSHQKDDRPRSPRREPTETDPIVGLQRGRSHRARNKNELRLSRRSKPTTSNSNSNSNSPTSSYGSMGESPLASCASQSPRQATVSGSSDEQVAAAKRRKKSLGERTKRVLSRFKRSLAGSVAPPAES